MKRSGGGRWSGGRSGSTAGFVLHPLAGLGKAGLRFLSREVPTQQISFCLAPFCSCIFFYLLLNTWQQFFCLQQLFFVEYPTHSGKPLEYHLLYLPNMGTFSKRLPSSLGD